MSPRLRHLFRLRFPVGDLPDKRWLLALLILTQAGRVAAQDGGVETWQKGTDPVARLWQQAAKGETSLEAKSDASWLSLLLRGLDIPPESQVLVFSKTSLQKVLIGPARPRAIYYNEDCYIGWVRGGEMEIIAADPLRGLQYYLVKQPFVKPARPVPVSSNQCLSCHVGGNLQLQSVYTRETGYPIGTADILTTTYESPLAERWGGWYVTGRHGHERHMGNVVAHVRGGRVSLDRARGANVESLEDWVSTSPYPVTTSDIVSLMVLEHQYVMHNTLHEAGRSIQRVMAADSGAVGLHYDAAARDRILRKRAREIVEKLLFAGEYTLKDGGVSGDAAFQKAFRRNRRMTADGRSLKDFDLNTQLFKYRCSYMIYSASFKGLPHLLKKAVYEHLAEILTPGQAMDGYAYLKEDERLSIRQILLQTDPDAQMFWQAEGPAQSVPAAPSNEAVRTKQ